LKRTTCRNRKCAFAKLVGANKMVKTVLHMNDVNDIFL